jgi:hypothetical protein
MISIRCHNRMVLLSNFRTHAEMRQSVHRSAGAAGAGLSRDGERA